MARGLAGERLCCFLIQVKAPCEAGNFEFNQLQCIIHSDFFCVCYIVQKAGMCVCIGKRLKKWIYRYSVNAYQLVQYIYTSIVQDMIL